MARLGSGFVMNASLDGLLTGLSLIVAIGAQNAFVLRQGLRTAYVGPVVAVCTVSDFVLIVAGVAGIGVIVQHAGWALVAVRWFGPSVCMAKSSAARSSGCTNCEALRPIISWGV